MSTNQINIFQLGPEVSTQRMHNARPMTHLAIEGNFITSELQAINWCHVSKGILFLRNITNHQVTHLQKSATDIVTNFNMIQLFYETTQKNSIVEDVEKSNENIVQ